jgi:hypothetical protein
MTLRLLGPKGELITSVDAWTRPKEKDRHWKDGRSAKSLAEAWFRDGVPAVPTVLVNLLESHPLTRRSDLEEGRPEFVTRLPMRGEGRNHDLWLRGRVPAGTLVVGIEAKADEPFAERLDDALKKLERKKGLAKELGKDFRTGWPLRTNRFLTGLFGPQATIDAAPWTELRYQLLAGAAGTLIQAGRDGAAVAAFVVHEFHTPSTKPEKLATNLADYHRFVELLLPGQGTWEAGQLFGPVALQPGQTEFPEIPLLVGRIVTDTVTP